jgi:hypothetical protein
MTNVNIQHVWNLNRTLSIPWSHSHTRITRSEMRGREKTTNVTHAYHDGRLPVPEIHKPPPRKTDHERTVLKKTEKTPHKPSPKPQLSTLTSIITTNKYILIHRHSVICPVTWLEQFSAGTQRFWRHLLWFERGGQGYFRSVIKNALTNSAILWRQNFYWETIGVRTLYLSSLW